MLMTYSIFHGRTLESIGLSVRNLTIGLSKKYESNETLKFLEKNKIMPLGDSFNASLIVINSKGEYTNLVTSSNDYFLTTFNNLYFTRKYLCKLDHNLHAIQCSKLNVPFHIQDGRLFTVDGRMYIAFTNMNKYYVQKQAIYCPRTSTIFHPKFNDVKGIMNKEKNWQFFQYGADLYMLYHINPFTLYSVDKHTFEITGKICEKRWQHPKKLRCSAPPIFINGKFYMVVHCIQYRTYVMTFDQHFHLLKASSTPLCESKAKCQYDIYFPCGLVYDTIRDSFIISYGINDTAIAFMTITKMDMDSKLDINIQSVENT
jgi:predicted GH43/DUF377 family glycosyl hydrolase